MSPLFRITTNDQKVRDGDGSSRLDYTSARALSALDGGRILRASANPVTPADLTLPEKGTAGSLGWSSEIVVDVTAVFIVDVSPRVRYICIYIYTMRNFSGWLRLLVWKACCGRLKRRNRKVVTRFSYLPWVHRFVGMYVDDRVAFGACMPFAAAFLF